MAEIRLTVWKSYDILLGLKTNQILSPLRILLERRRIIGSFGYIQYALGFVVYGIEHVIFHHRDLWAFVSKEKARAYAHNVYTAEQPCKLLIASWSHFVHGTFM